MAKILVVEDADSLRNAYVYALEKRGHKVSSATHGREALVVVKNASPDIILLDLLMPQMSGLDFLRKHAKAKHQKILVFSNIDTDVNLAYQLGADAFMLKYTLNPTQMVEWVEENLAIPQKQG